jgi:group I intron endonuclease
MSESKIIAIYAIKNIIDNKIYIGSTNDLERRWRDHKSLLSRNCHHSIHLQNAWNKFSKENFVFEILEVLNDEKEILLKEQTYLDIFASYDQNIGYNISKVAGSAFKGRNHSKESKLKQSIGNSGSNHWAFGNHLTEEHKESISKANRKISKDIEQEVIEKYNLIKNAYIVAKTRRDDL